MKTNDFVVINNRAYDPITGLPVEGVNVAEKKEVPADKPVEPAVRRSEAIRGISTPALHRSTERSATLSRRYVRKPTTLQPLDRKEIASIKATKPTAQPQFASQSTNPEPSKPTLEKFSKMPTTQTIRPDRPAEKHPVARRASQRPMDIMSPQHQRMVAAQKISPQNKPTSPVAKEELKPASVLKNEAIAEAMNREVAEQKKTPRAKTRQSRWKRFMTFASASLAVVLLGGYLTYLSMPNLSIKMAAVQSGVNAKYPGYHPDGYALNGPITFKDDEVSMQFAYADGGNDFTITQKRSNWDSSAVKEYVTDQNNGTTTTTIADGLTIYSYDGNAAWVNGGVLYTIEGTAPLSSDQIRRIATSM